MLFCPDFNATNPGDRRHVLRSPKVNHDGTITLVENGFEDLQEYYNSQEQVCDISLIMERFKAGDVDALNAWNPIYGDFTKAPTTLAEYMQYQLDVDALFSSLPIELRNKYDNSVSKFTAVAGEKEWLEDCLPYFSEEAKSFYQPYEKDVLDKEDIEE